jgi:hypothetical protein
MNGHDKYPSNEHNRVYFDFVCGNVDEALNLLKITLEKNKHQKHGPGVTRISASSATTRASRHWWGNKKIVYRNAFRRLIFKSRPMPKGITTNQLTSA